MELKELIDRVKEATGPDRSLDEAIALALCDEHFFAQLADAPEGTGCEMYRFGQHSPHSALRVTDSIDACLALVERCLPGWAVTVATFHTDYGSPYADMASRRYIENDEGHEDEYAEAAGKTAPLAIILALLTALDQKEENK